MRTFLVWEGSEMPVPETRRGFDTRPVEKTVTEFNTVPFLKQAEDENDACLKVIRQTKRLSKFAVCEVQLIDFAAVLEEEDEPKGQQGSLTVETSASDSA